MAANPFSGPSPSWLLPQRAGDLTSEENRIRFTPVKTARSAPRVWDRKPSTAFGARSKSRKVWKRFRTSFNSLKMLQQMIAAEDDGPQLEINGARNAEYLRGVKRRFLLLENPDQDRNPAEQTYTRSFLETKWESEATGRKHKLPAKCSDLVDSSDAVAVHGSSTGAISDDSTPYRTTQPTDTSKGPGPVQAGVDESESVNPPPGVPTDAHSVAAYPPMLHGESSCLQSGVEDESTDINTHDPIDSPGTGPDATALGEPEDGDAALAATMTHDPSGEHEVAAPSSPAPGAPVQDLPAELESTLVRSALRSSLDGEDAQLLNNFLFKAKAKREAKAAAAMVAHDDKDKQPSPEAPEGVDSPTPQSTPQSRRVLKDLDTNSPSPQKSPQRCSQKPPQRSPKQSPQKSPQRPPLSPPKPRDQATAPDRQQPASPRRSTRTRTPKPPARAAAAPTVRNTLSLRRPKGTEFIFNQRTEAQELALATRRNTRQNRGDAMMPKYALKHIENSPASGAEDAPRPTSTRRKQVSWNDAQLVQFEGDGDDNGQGDGDGKSGNPDVGKGRSEKRKATTSRGTRSKEGDQSLAVAAPAASTNAPATATPKARRMRRLGAPKSAEASLDPSASPPLSSSSATLGGTPDRRKLTPKSAKPSSTSLFGSRPSLRSSVHNSSLLQSHAGSTPVPRRVRSRT